MSKSLFTSRSWRHAAALILGLSTSVTYADTLQDFAGELQQRGWQVSWGIDGSLVSAPGIEQQTPQVADQPSPKANLDGLGERLAETG